jgi:hypothetical protein
VCSRTTVTPFADRSRRASGSSTARATASRSAALEARVRPAKLIATYARSLVVVLQELKRPPFLGGLLALVLVILGF